MSYCGIRLFVNGTLKQSLHKEDWLYSEMLVTAFKLLQETESFSVYVELLSDAGTFMTLSRSDKFAVLNQTVNLDIVTIPAGSTCEILDYSHGMIKLGYQHSASLIVFFAHESLLGRV